MTQQAPDLQSMTQTSISQASERIQSGECTAAIAIVRQLMRVLQEHRGTAGQEQCLNQCLEALGDAYAAGRQFEQALNSYEETLSMRTKALGETAPDCMTVLFKIEKTLAASVDYPKNISPRATGTRWQSRLVMSGAASGADAAAASEQKNDLPAEQLNELWETALKKNQQQRETAEIKRAAEAIRKVDSCENAGEKMASMGTQLVFAFAPIVILCLIIGIFFKCMPHITGGMDNAVKSREFKFVTMQSVPANTMDTLHGIVNGTNRVYVSGDQNQKLQFDNADGQLTNEGRSYSMPYLVDDGTPINRLSLCLYTLAHKKTLWLVPDLYGLEDQFGNVYFAEGSSENRLASQIKELSLHLQTLKPDDVKNKLKDEQYDDPWTGNKENVVVIEAKADSIQSALSQLSQQIHRRDPFTVFCLLVDTGKQVQIALCGLDRDKGLIPFGNRARNFVGLDGVPEPQAPKLDPEQVGGMVVLPVPSTIAHYAGQIACLAISILFIFGSIMCQRPAARVLCFAVAALLAVIGGVGLLGAA